MMRYLPFIIISIILYILFFYHNQQSELIISGSTISSEEVSEKIITLDFKKVAQQDKQQVPTSVIQFVKAEYLKEEQIPVTEAMELATDSSTVSDIPKQASTESIIAIDAPKQASIDSVIVANAPKQAATDLALLTMAKTSLQITEEVPSDNTLIVVNTVDNSQQKNTSTTISQQSNNNIKYFQASIKSTPASDAALLKGEIYERYFYVDLPPEPKKQAKQRSITDSINKKETTVITKAPSQVIVKEVNGKNKRSFKKQVKPSQTLNKNKGLQEAIAVSGNKPDYPNKARNGNLQGEVSIKFTVNMRGYSKNPQVISSSGHKALDDAVLDFINNERFMPALEGIEKVTSEQQYSFSYK